MPPGLGPTDNYSFLPIASADVILALIHSTVVLVAVILIKRLGSLNTFLPAIARLCCMSPEYFN